MMTEQMIDEYLDEIRPKPTPEEQAEPHEPTWNGRSSKISLAVGALLNRDGHLISAGSTCIDCNGKEDRTHQFHIRASKNGDGVWTGPEAAHYHQLKSLGMLRSTVEAERRLEAEGELAYIRGVEPSSKCRNCGAPIPRSPEGQLAGSCEMCHARNGLPELKSLTLAELKKLWGNAAFHEKAVLLEKGQIRDEVAQLRSALEDGVVVPLRDMIRELLGEVSTAKGRK